MTTRRSDRIAYALARRMQSMKPSAVREILKVAERPDILSFAGGLPAPELFPIAEISEAMAKVLADEGQAALQYSTTEGFAPLRAWISDRLAGRGVNAPVEQVLVTNGSQQGIDLVSKVLLDPGDVVAVENPSYLAALQVFAGAEAELEVVESDDGGMMIDELAALLSRRKVKLLYLVPDFSNPKGTSLAESRRQRLIELCAEHGVIILADDPYGELKFAGTRPPSLAALDEHGVVLELGTFSKTLAPGLRVGWLTGPAPLVLACTTAKQAADLHNATVNQRAIATLLRSFDYDAHLAKIRGVYGRRANAMLSALAEHLPSNTRFTRPEGGMFIWVELPEGLDAVELLQRSVEEKVAFVPGAPFFANQPKPNSLRLNYSNRDESSIALGMARLGRVIESARLEQPEPRVRATAGEHARASR